MMYGVSNISKIPGDSCTKTKLIKPKDTVFAEILDKNILGVTMNRSHICIMAKI